MTLDELAMGGEDESMAKGSVFISSSTGWIYVTDKAESEPSRAAAI